ncbi:4-amino-4-deoxychorismate lyase [Psychrobacter sp. PL19]|uniref:aminotransferase class IV n=1 Tax=Psychrobacter sp. PL19 TaxID=2760711 RepID=UPI001AE27E32
MTAQPDGWSRLQPPDYAEDKATDKVSVTLDNRGLTYADGFFTTMGVIDGLILWQDCHHQRLISHAQALQFAIDDQALLAMLQVHAQQLQQGMLKLIITRAVQDVRGYGFTPSVSGSVCEIWLKSSAMTINTTEQAHLPDGRVVLMQPASSAVCLTSQMACLPPILAGLKSLNRLDSVLASGELQRIKSTELNLDKRLGEGLVRDMMGSWVEGTMSNVFYQLASDDQLADDSKASLRQSFSSSEITTQNNIKNPHLNEDYLLNGQWLTPPLTQSGVAGVMRQVVIDGFATTDNPVQMRVLTDDDLPHITRLFFCNAVRGVMPVTALTLLSGDRVCFSA